MKKILLIAICSIICEGMSAMAPLQVDLNDPDLLDFFRDSIEAEAIFRAACENNVPALRLLRTAKPSIVNERNEQGNTPLEIAVFYGKVDAVEELLTPRDSQVADVNAGSRGYTPLYRAVELAATKRKNAAIPIINLLINGGADPSIRADGFPGTPLEYARSYEGCGNDVIALLEAAAGRAAAN
ncbi:MAG: ankyrin repeat domain-containing protein [Holosporaceae bacterium]|jgi:hypothetical protein|nr:ankyrin repeat domain-containing protein [Holosporaceae bacterium]